MRNITSLPRKALKFRLNLQRTQTVEKALSPFSPVGWCAIAQQPGQPSCSVWGGEADTQAHTPVAQDTIFRIASISKVFGAAAALRLVARGKLTLDDPVAEVFGFSIDKPITLRQLLTHTAAIDDAALYDEVLGTPDAPPLGALLKKSFFDYAPGTRFHYSNLGAGVAGMLVEQASGILFDDFVRQEFFVPYGIDASFHPQRIVHKERMANCYYVPGRRLAYDAQAIASSPYDEAPSPRTHYHIPAGKLMISAPDLLSAFQRLPKEDSALFVHQDHIGSVQCDSGRGLGIAMSPKGVFDKNRAFWGHQGQAYGAVCEAWMDLSDGTAAVLLTNGVKLLSIGPLQLAGQSGITALLAHKEGDTSNL